MNPRRSKFQRKNVDLRSYSFKHISASKARRFSNMALFIFLFWVTLQIIFSLKAFPVRDLASQPFEFNWQTSADIITSLNAGKSWPWNMIKVSRVSGWSRQDHHALNTHRFSQSPPSAEPIPCKQPSCRNISQTLLPFVFHSLALLVVQTQTPAV